VERDLQVLGVRRWREMVIDKEKMERYYSTSQSPQRAVAPTEEELNKNIRYELEQTCYYLYLFHCAFRTGRHIIEFGTDSTDAGKTTKYKTDIVYIPKVLVNLPFFSASLYLDYIPGV
jgi:hypothetical protein